MAEDPQARGLRLLHDRSIPVGGGSGAPLRGRHGPDDPVRALPGARERALRRHARARDPALPHHAVGLVHGGDLLHLRRVAARLRLQQAGAALVAARAAVPRRRRLRALQRRPRRHHRDPEAKAHPLPGVAPQLERDVHRAHRGAAQGHGEQHLQRPLLVHDAGGRRRGQRHLRLRVRRHLREEVRQAALPADAQPEQDVGGLRGRVLHDARLLLLLRAVPRALRPHELPRGQPLLHAALVRLARPPRLHGQLHAAAGSEGQRPRRVALAAGGARPRHRPGCVAHRALGRLPRIGHQARLRHQGLRHAHPRPRRRHGPHGLPAPHHDGGLRAISHLPRAALRRLAPRHAHRSRIPPTERRSAQGARGAPEACGRSGRCGR
mmetsp:Transcript_10246/g.30584  ORF Transcript_10246/g.30584 Transcript_10246/m.30584 type:complete len:380 (-) Transcript_10246:1143-2282(-)